jgi:2-octaprenylphenol hydroxylase
MKRRFDLAIIGGGMVGAALACLLAGSREELRIALVEAREPAAPDLDPERFPGLRVSAISRASQRVLEACGAWPRIRDTGISPYARMVVWDAGAEPFGHGSLCFDSAELGVACLGHIIDNGLLQWALWGRLAAHPQVTVYCPERLAGLELDQDHALLRLESGKRITASLAVGADGSGSPSRVLAGIDVSGKSYDQSAVVTHIRTERAHQETAWQRFLPDGPLALLPLQDGRCSIVWSTTPERAAMLQEADEQSFRDQVTEASAGVLGDVIHSGPRAGFPLRLQHARAYTGTRFALIGDAAHTVHPLAGQGVNLGFLDAAALAEVVLDAVTAGHDPGESRPLRRYERWRKGENLLAATGIDAIGRLFREPHAVIGAVRRLGLTLVDDAAMLKHELARRAMGVGGDLPRFARSPGPATTDTHPSGSE